jgi:hypothetical protein
MWFEKDVGNRASRPMFLYHSFARTAALLDTFGFSVNQNAFFPSSYFKITDALKEVEKSEDVL